MVSTSRLRQFLIPTPGQSLPSRKKLYKEATTTGKPALKNVVSTTLEWLRDSATPPLPPPHANTQHLGTTRMFLQYVAHPSPTNRL